MNRILLKLSKVPPRVSFILIAVSIFIAGPATMLPTVALTWGDVEEGFRNGVNSLQSRAQQSNQYRGPVTKAIDKTYQRVTTSGCPQSYDSTLSSGRLVEMGEEPASDPLAVELFKIPVGTPGKEVLRRAGYPAYSSQKKMSDFYRTSDGTIAVKYERRNRVSRVVSVGFVQE